jgi:transglutaminase-like putative cysteine protease
VHKRVEFYLRATTVGGLLCAYWCLSVTALIGPWILIVGFALLAIMPHMEWLDRRYSRGFRQTMISLVVFTLPILVVVGFVSDWVQSVVGLVLLIQAHELAREKDERNYQIVFLMSICTVFVSCVKSQEAALGVALFAYAPCALFSLYFFHVFFESRRAGGQIALEVSTDRGINTGGIAGDTPKRRRTPFAHVSAVILLTIGLAAIMFFALPRTEAGILGGSDIISYNVTGLSRSVDIATTGTIQQDTSPVMQATFPSEPGGMYVAPMYWRVTVMDEFTGTGWERTGKPYEWDSKLSLQSFRGAGPGPLIRVEKLRDDPTQSRLVQQSVFIDSLTTDGLPMLNYPLRIECRDASLRWTPSYDLTVMVRNRRSKSLQYTVYSEVFENDLADLESAPDNYKDLIRARDYNTLTKHNLSPESRATIGAALGNARTPYEKAVALDQWFKSGQFIYALVLPDIKTDKPIDAFINVTKVGHCQLFATAMALALRSEGIPTRVVSGYMGGEWDPNSRTYTITADMAHLWVEAYFSGVGWHTFDPSPIQRTRDDSILARFERAMVRTYLRSKIVWYRDIVAYDSPIRLDRLSQLPTAFIQWVPNLMRGNTAVTEIGQTDSGLTGVAVKVIVLLISLTAAIYFVLRRRGYVALRSLTLTPDQRRAVTLFMKLTAQLKRQGVDCQRLTAREVLEKAVAQGGLDTHELSEILDTYNTVRFGLRPLSPSGLKSSLQRIRSVKLAQPSKN